MKTKPFHLLLLLPILVGISNAHAERAFAISVPIEPVFFSACALGGQGEFIDASGEVHLAIKGDAIPIEDPLQIGENGFWVFGWNLIGYGRTSGHQYRLIDSVQQVAHAPGDGNAASWFFNIRANFIDAGADGSISQLTQTFRVVLVDGVPVVSLFNSALECRGVQ